MASTNPFQPVNFLVGRTNLPRSLIPILAVILASCRGDARVDDRRGYWESEVKLFFSDDRSLDELHSWLREREIYYTFDSEDILDDVWTVTLEKVYVDTFRCEWINIDLRVNIASQVYLGRWYEVAVSGNCLW